jgi:hypothetical protein
MALRLGDPIDTRIPWVRRLLDLDDARAVGSPGPRLDALRHAGQRLGDGLREGPRVVAVRTFDLSRLLYPTAFAFHGAAIAPAAPYVVMRHRMLLVQVLAEGALRNILFNPTDVEAGRAVGYYREIIETAGERVSRFIQEKHPTPDEHLRAAGVDPADVDLVAFDHFHIQDLRKLHARFPHAVLLAPRREWEDWDHLHPLQRAWFIEDGKKGVPASGVALTEHDLWLGDGCVLLRTPGHTVGNQTIFVHGEQGVFGCSENGTSCDSWSPHESRIPGLARAARMRELEAILNCNTPEHGAEQYTSMILEKSVVDRVPEAPAFAQMFPSSEVSPSWMAPGIAPSLLLRARTSGELRTGKRPAPRAREGARAAPAAAE